MQRNGIETRQVRRNAEKLYKIVAKTNIILLQMAIDSATSEKWQMQCIFGGNSNLKSALARYFLIFWKISLVKMILNRRRVHTHTHIHAYRCKCGGNRGCDGCHWKCNNCGTGSALMPRTSISAAVSVRSLPFGDKDWWQPEVTVHPQNLPQNRIPNYRSPTSTHLICP